MAHNFAQSIKWGRIYLGVDFEQIAADMNIDPDVLWQIEKGQVIPDRQTILQLALYLRLDKAELLAKAEVAKRRSAGF